MIVFYIFLVSLLLLPKFSLAQKDARKIFSLSDKQIVTAAEKGQKRTKGEPIKTIDDYEKDKLRRLKKNIGKRFIALKTPRPPEFYASPEDLKKKISVKEKEEFSILDVVQNQYGTMNFYKVRLESGKIGYLEADGSNLELRIKDGSIMTVTKRLGKKKSSSRDRTRESAAKAIEKVKSHLIPSDPVSKDKRSVERRMREVKATSSPNLKWRYEAKAIGSNRYRVTQYAEGESDRVIVRTWTVDLRTSKVRPENPAAKVLYR
jgi:hypothetical protein